MAKNVDNQKEREPKKGLKKLRNKFRLVIINDETFEERFSFVLSPLNVFTWGGFFLILFSVLLVSVIAFTPLREMIPGYANVSMKRSATYASFRSDSLSAALQQQQQYLENLRLILNGEDTRDNFEDSSHVQNQPIDTGALSPSSAEEELRTFVEDEERYTVNNNDPSAMRSGISSFSFFTPLSGVLSSTFEPEKGHYGVDVLAKNNEAVKSTLDGTVLIATWSSETGHVIQVQHANNLVSIYKHNSVLLKQVGDKVKAGEAIAIVGNSGELTTGPHLHFELWADGQPLNPEDYMNF